MGKRPRNAHVWHIRSACSATFSLNISQKLNVLRMRVKLVNSSMVGVAQLVEPWIVIPVVVGSSPIVHPLLMGIFV